MQAIHKILRKPFFGRFEVPWEWPNNSQPHDWEKISFKNPGNAKLAGLWGPARGEALATLVLAHPMGKSAKGFWLRYGHAELFRNAGYNVLLFDANGFGESEAVSFDYPADVLAAGQYAQQRRPQLAVGLVGASFGAGWGLCSMAREGSPFKAAIFEAAFPTLPDFWKHYPVAHAVLKFSKAVTPWIEKGLRPELEATRLVNHPAVLLLYGDADIYTPPVHGERLLKALKQSAKPQMAVVAGGLHTYLYRDQADQYQTLALPFLRTALGTVH